MGLKLTVQRLDVITIGDDISLKVLTTSNKQTQLEFFAPHDIQIDTWFHDKSKMFKNKRKL